LMTTKTDNTATMRKLITNFSLMGLYAVLYLFLTQNSVFYPKLPKIRPLGL